LPQIRDFTDACHRHGKKAILHMCGLLKALSQALRETGMDGVNGLTPPEVGDLPYEQALDIWGDEVAILGGVLDPGVFQKRKVARAEIHAELDRIYTPRLRRSAFLLWAGADGLPTPLENFLWVRDWFEAQASV
jgi:uroporphyrinogen-III decarboxylase